MHFTWTLSEYRSITGEGNNEEEPDWGVAGIPVLRFTGYDYADGISSPSGEDRPSAREISNTVLAQTESIPNATGVSDLFWVWGQFIDHDIDLFSAPETIEHFDIVVPIGDIFFDPEGIGTEVIPFERSGFDPTPAPSPAHPREQVNEITAFIDASMVYGSDPERAEFLRDAGGKLKVSEGDFLPLNDGTFPNQGPDGATGPLAGDVRAGENVALLSLHTIFVREHNRLVDEIAEAHPEYDDERLYQEAKAIVEAEIQVITYKEYLPLLLGPDTLEQYQGYNDEIDPGIVNVFATAAYRVGHTMLSAELLRLEEDGDASSFGALALRDAFFNPDALTEEGGVAPLLRGLSEQLAQEVDPYIIDDVRNFLFGQPGDGGFDLASLNIQRGRDHGLPSYNEVRIAYGLIPVADFSDITSNLDIQTKLQAVYGSVDNIDVFVGGLAEDHVEGGMIGSLFSAILVDQFERIRDGDRFWYENRFSGEALEQIESVSLADIIKLNSDIEYLQQNVMLAYDRVGGTTSNDRLSGGAERDLLIGFEGNDRIDAGGSDDHVEAGSGNDRISGGAGNDYIDGGEGKDKISGGDGDDELRGGPGRDIIEGGPGDDVLIGGLGRDQLLGGSGSDTFRYLDALELGDILHDFDPSEDIIDLSSLANLDPTSVEVSVQDDLGEVHATTIDGLKLAVADVHFVVSDLSLLDTDPELQIIV